MIGFIAGAGIVVRNSIILVDFIELRLSEGMPLDQAVIDAGAVRFRPMMLTAAAVVVGSSVILFDPIFQGLAIALMAGEIASLLLSRMTVPVLFYLFNKHAHGVSSRATVYAVMPAEDICSTSLVGFEERKEPLKPCLFLVCESSGVRCRFGRCQTDSCGAVFVEPVEGQLSILADLVVPSAID